MIINSIKNVVVYLLLIIGLSSCSSYIKDYPYIGMSQKELWSELCKQSTEKNRNILYASDFPEDLERNAYQKLSESLSPDKRYNIKGIFPKAKKWRFHPANKNISVHFYFNDKGSVVNIDVFHLK